MLAEKGKLGILNTHLGGLGRQTVLKFFVLGGNGLRFSRIHMTPVHKYSAKSFCMKVYRKIFQASKVFFCDT